MSWIDDTAPHLDPASWPLIVAGRRVDVAELRAERPAWSRGDRGE